MEKVKKFFVRVFVWVRATLGAFLAIFWPKAWPHLAKAIVSGVMAQLVALHLWIDPTYIAGSGEVLWLPLGTWNEILTWTLNGLGSYITVWLIPNKEAGYLDKQDPVVRTVVEIPPK